jgi:hypothetical protein
MIKQIAWSKWIDPLGRNRNEFEYIPEAELDPEEFDNNLEEMYESGDGDSDSDGDGDGDNNVNSPLPVILTPLGILPIKPFNDATKMFNFWMGETNFNLGKNRRAIINNVPGVEILDVFTRYKFRIAVGNLFKFQEVRQSIEEALGIKQWVMSEKVKDVIKHVSSNPYWAVYVLPSGQMDIATSLEQTEDFTEKINGYMEMRKTMGGTIFKYDEQYLLPS